MAVVWARQKSGRTWGRDEQGQEKGKRVYLVRCDDLTDDPDTAAAACPGEGTAWSAAKPGLIVRNVAADETSRGEDYVLFDVALDYSTKSQDGKDPGQQEEHPLDRLPEVSLDFETFEEGVFKAEDVPTGIDANGNTVSLDWKWAKNICNSAGDDFEEQPKRVFYDPVITITRNEPGLAWTTAIEYAGAVNSDAFTITYRGNNYSIAAGQAKMMPPTTKSMYENGVDYEAVTYRIAIRKDGWLTNIKDAGLRALQNGDTPARPIRDGNGDEIQKPVLLDGSGNPRGTNKVAVFLRFRNHTLKTFGSLNLDQPYGS